MSRPQLQDSEAATIPDKAMLATVLNFLKNKNLKETEEALRKELSNQGDAQPLSSAAPVTAIGQSGTEPTKYEESYTSQAPLTSTTTTTTTAASVQLAQEHIPSSVPKPPSLCSITVTPKQPLVLLSQEEDHSDDEDAYETDGEVAEEVTSTDSPVKTILPPLVRLPPLKSNVAAASPHLSSSFQLSPTQIRGTPLSPPLSSSTAVKATLDNKPLWLKSPVVSSNSPDAKKSVFLPFSSGISLTGSAISGVGVIDRPPTVTTAANGSAGGTAQGIAVPPSLMYQLMSPPCITRPLLAPVLTVLPSSANLLSQQPVFLANSINTTGSNLGLQSATAAAPSAVIKSYPPQLSPEHVEKSSPVSTLKETTVQTFMAEPATGQAININQDSPVSTTFSPTGPRTLASIPPAELTPQHLELKAFAEDFKTRRIRLGFTQGAVGQSLAERGYNNFAQSTISRFEQMQLSPANAATIRVILEKWLLEAESPESASSSSSGNGNFPQMASRKRKKRAVFTPQTKSILDEFFSQNPRPNRQAIENISQKLDLLPEEVRVWFCNKRQKSKSASSYHHRASFDRESSSATSSGVPSPVNSEGGLSQKRRSPSPPKTPFTIEELSKSSTNSMLVSSPLKPSNSSMLPLGLVASITQSTSLPLLFNSPAQGAQMFSNPLLSQSAQVSQTRA